MTYLSLRNSDSYLDIPWEDGCASVLLCLRRQSVHGHRTQLDPEPLGWVSPSPQESGSRLSTRGWSHPHGAQTIPYLKEGKWSKPVKKHFKSVNHVIICVWTYLQFLSGLYKTSWSRGGSWLKRLTSDLDKKSQPRSQGFGEKPWERGWKNPE